MKITVIMSEYNTPLNILTMAIESILRQSYSDFEFIIVDDGGKNNMVKIIEDFNDPRIKLLRNSSNRGFVYSLNKALKRADGEYIVRMDSDDITDPDRIEKLYDFISSHNQYSVVGTKAEIFSDKKVHGIIGIQGEKTMRSIIHGDIVVHASTIMKKSDILAVGGYKDYKRAEDFVLWCDLLLAGYRLYMLDEILYRYRVNEGDYEKRKLKYRLDELQARLQYYPKMGASPIEYLFILRSIVAGLMPVTILRLYQEAKMRRLQNKK